MTQENYSSEKDTKEHIANVSHLLYLCQSELASRGIFHDASKLDDDEKKVFDIYTPKLKKATFGSEEYKGFLNEMKGALKHHYENNRHHPEHFENGIMGMNLFDIVEMLCDWYAASKRHENGDIQRSISVCSQKFSITSQLELILRNTIDTILKLEKEQKNKSEVGKVYLKNNHGFTYVRGFDLDNLDWKDLSNEYPDTEKVIWAFFNDGALELSKLTSNNHKYPNHFMLLKIKNNKIVSEESLFLQGIIKWAYFDESILN